jgi:hypothetical protein
LGPEDVRAYQLPQGGVEGRVARRPTYDGPSPAPFV